MKTDWIPAAAAAARLGVSRATLYAYASRGLLRVAADPADPRRSLYDPEGLDALAERQKRGRARRQVAASTTDWGEPILATSLTRIGGGRFFYRGRDALALAEGATLEEVAALLWALPVPRIPVPRIAVQQGMPPLQRGLLAVAAIAGEVEGPLPPPRLAAAAARLLGLVAGAAAGEGGQGPLHRRFATAWGLDARGADLVRRALVLCADHELNASAYTARVVASTGASLGAAVLAGLAALSGPQHGGMTNRVLAMAREGGLGRNPRATLAARLARGEALPGLGHRLYPQGDPRAAALLAACPPPAPWRRMIAAAEDLTGQPPALDMALAMMEHSLPLPPGGGLALFATGRTVGWIAHALEQRAEGRLIRPRAEYRDDIQPPAAPLDGAPN
ncbi:citrate synthase [Roseomonas sp. GC11]|uniref:citrate synthase n=1 Tax=Roseomonas sp. GC11 TaxID=2950546 RepID=UPI00210DD73B|nr:citrate synthase [Roseomonas sp. GC11]MCQ4160782.1 citrate synthase [Roseomonas sp. GC11]